MKEMAELRERFALSHGERRPRSVALPSSVKPSLKVLWLGPKTAGTLCHNRIAKGKQAIAVTWSAGEGEYRSESAPQELGTLGTGVDGSRRRSAQPRISESAVL